MIGVGDIGECGAAAVAQTARLVEGIPGTLVLAGDIAYPHGSTDDFRRCFDPWWGKFRDRWRPSPGNHEYETPGAQGYFDYFGAVAGPAGRGYYSFRAGEWLVLMLNSNERFVSTRAGSAQYEFVRSELQTNPTRCAMAVWHHPIFSSGPNGPNNYLRDLWGLLDRHDVELVVNGHDHLYERFAKQDIDMRRDDKGIRQITAGGGGAHLYRFPRIEPNSEVRITNNGVLKLTLTPTGYEWQFIEVSGAVTDAGSDVCF